MRCACMHAITDGVSSPQAAHKEQIDRLMSRAHHHRKAMNDEKFTVEHLVLALAENQRWGKVPGMQPHRMHGRHKVQWHGARPAHVSHFSSVPGCVAFFTGSLRSCSVPRACLRTRSSRPFVRVG